MAQLEEMVDDSKLRDSENKETRTMSEASFIDREWEEVDWERVKTLPMVCLIPPDGKYTLIPLPFPSPRRGGIGVFGTR